MVIEEAGVTIRAWPGGHCSYYFWVKWFLLIWPSPASLFLDHQPRCGCTADSVILYLLGSGSGSGSGVWKQKLLVPWYWYVLLGFVDVQSNYLGSARVMILDCWTIAWVIVLIWIFLDTQYSLWQFFRAGACLGGLGLVLLSDYNPSVGGGSKPLFGDTLVIVGTVFLSMSSVGMEFYVKKKDHVEVMMMIGMFGILVSASGMAMLERKGLESINWSPQLVSR